MLCLFKTQNHVSFIDYHAINYRNSNFEAILRFRFFPCFPQCARPLKIYPSPSESSACQCPRMVSVSLNLQTKKLRALWYSVYLDVFYVFKPILDVLPGLMYLPQFFQRICNNFERRIVFVFFKCDFVFCNDNNWHLQIK